MENYRHARTLEQPSSCPFSDLHADTPHVRVKDGSKIRNLLRFALSRMEPRPRAPGAAEGAEPRADDGRSATETAPPCRQMVFTANAKGISKAITCAELLKRRVHGLHQITRLDYAARLEVWEPLEATAGLDTLTVSRKIPALWILLARDPLDPAAPGYQAPGSHDALWAQALREEGGGGGGLGGGRQPTKRRRGGGGGRGGGPGGGRGKGRPSGRERLPEKGQS